MAHEPIPARMRPRARFQSRTAKEPCGIVGKRTSRRRHSRDLRLQNQAWPISCLAISDSSNVGWYVCGSNLLFHVDLRLGLLKRCFVIFHCSTRIRLFLTFWAVHATVYLRYDPHASHSSYAFHSLYSSAQNFEPHLYRGFVASTYSRAELCSRLTSKIYA